MLLKRIIPPLLAGAVFFAALKFLPARPPEELRVLLNSWWLTYRVDPAKAKFTNEFFYLENLYSPLLEYSADNRLVSGLAERFEWVGGEALFHMRPGLRTAGGRPIDAHDAEFSLKRLFVLGGGSAFLRQALCGPAPMKKVSDPCQGLSVHEGGRVLALRLPERKPFLFHLLANIAYAVVPRGSVDPVTLEITDYANTSGPYYAGGDPGAVRTELLANPFHYRYSADMPRRVRLVPTRGYPDSAAIFGLLKNGSADYLMTGVANNPVSKAGFVAGNPGYNLHFSRPIRLITVIFTERGMERLTREERFFIAGKLRALYRSRNTMAETPDQIFRMEGGLSKGQLAEIRQSLQADGVGRIEKKVAAERLYNFFWQDGEAIRAWLPKAVYADIERKRSGRAPATDFRVFDCEIGFQDDIGLVAYYLGLDFFRMTEAAKENWFARYMAAPDKDSRSAMLRALQYETLSKAQVLPLGLVPYASVARKPWRFHYPGAISGDWLWRLRRE